MGVLEYDFIFKNEIPTYPNVPTDGLLLWYDMKSLTNKRTNFEKLLDLSANKKHGELKGFNKTAQSGFNNGLVFDGVDDKLIRPTLEDIEVISSTKNLFNPSIEPYPNQKQLGVAVSWKVKVKPNTSYTLSTSVARRATSTYDVFFDIYSSTPSSSVNGVGEGFPRTVRSDSSGLLEVSSRPKATGQIDYTQIRSGAYWIQLEEGATATPYVPYIPTAKLTYQLNSNILSYDEDGVVRRVQDGKVVERKGVNLIRNSNFFNGVNGWRGQYGDVYATSNELVYRSTASTPLASRLEAYGVNIINHYQGHKYYVSGEVFAGRRGIAKLQFANISNNNVYNEIEKWSRLQSVITSVESGETPFRFYFNNDPTIGEDQWKYRNIQIIDLTATYGAGNEPTLEEIQANPEAWSWTPNPMDLIEATELKGNILGDVEGIIDDSNKNVAEGEVVYTDKADDSIVRVEVDGKSEQNAGSGKNLYRGKQSLMRASSNYLLINGIRTPLKKGTYMFSVKEVRNITKWRMYFALYKNGALIKENSSTPTHLTSNTAKYAITGIYQNNSVGIYLSTADTNATFYELTLDDDYDVVWGFSDTGGDSNINSEMLYPQIETGTVQTPYEPPAPSPEYPVEIKSLDKSFDIVSSVGGRNLLPNSSKEKTGLREFVNPWDMAPAFDKYGVDQTYTLSFDLKVEKEGRVSIYSVNSVSTKYGIPRTVYSVNTEYKRYSFSFKPSLSNTSETKAMLAFYGEYGSGVIPTVKNGKLELGEVVNPPYLPSPEDIAYDTQTPTLYKTNILLSEPLRSVGDVKDRLFLDTDGLWKIERNVGEKVLDSNTQIISSGAPTYEGKVSSNRYTLIQGLYGHANGIFEYCSHAPHKNQVWSNDDFLLGTSINGTSQFHIRLPNDITGVLEADVMSVRNRKWGEFFDNEKLKGTPFTIQYCLATPTIETLPQSEQVKLNNIQSFKGSNYVYTIANLEPNLKATFKPADWYKENLLINSLKVYNRGLTTEELLKNYNTEKRRWGL